MKSKIIEAALGKSPLDILITNTKLLNVFTREIYPAEIGICEGVIVSVDPPVHAKQSRSGRDATMVLDAKGKHALPGLVDTHVHIESSMMTPAGFAEAVLPLGTTTIVTDPHEIGNVLGLRGIRYMLKATENLPLRVYFQAPSSVPAVPGLETAGAEFNGPEITEMLSWERVIGLAEVMDYVGVINQSERMRQVLGAAQQAQTVISGHCPGLRGADLAAYMVAGPLSDHEGLNEDELLEKLRLGMYVEGRASSFNESMTILGKITTQLGTVPPNLVLCTDDIYPDDLLRYGHMDEVVRKGIAAGIPAVDLIRAATWNGAQRHRLHQLGAIAPGKWADIILVEDLNNFHADEVICRGKLVAAGGKMLVEAQTAAAGIEVENTMHISLPITPAGFQMPAHARNEHAQTAHSVRVQVMVIDPDLRRSLDVRSYPVVAGVLDISGDPDVCLVSIIERHGRSDNHSRVLVRGLGLQRGAAATTVSHDCHNLVVIGRDVQDMALAAQTLINCGGGICSVSAGEVQALLPLPVAGLMNPGRVGEVAAMLEKLNQALTAQGILQKRPLTGLLSLALPVIPAYGITDFGLVDVGNQTLLPIYVE